MTCSSFSECCLADYVVQRHSDSKREAAGETVIHGKTAFHFCEGERLFVAVLGLEKRKTECLMIGRD